MGQIPYVKWYVDDWIGGTLYMDRRHKGAYMDLLILQVKEGPFSEQRALSCLGCDSDCWETLSKKFSTDENGMRFNAKMQSVIERAMAYSQSRKSNRTSYVKHMSDICQTYDNHMSNICQTYVEHMGSGSRSVSNTEKRREESAERREEKHFEEFWQAYPRARRVGKGAARRAWAKVARPAETLAAILAALEWQSVSEQWTKEGGQFVPLPSTYLNQERWLDEPPVRVAKAMEEKREREEIINKTQQIAVAKMESGEYITAQEYDSLTDGEKDRCEPDTEHYKACGEWRYTATRSVPT